MAVAAGLRRMVPTVGSSSYDEEAQMEVEDSSYSYFVECFVGRFLQESLHTALQSRGAHVIIILYIFYFFIFLFLYLYMHMHCFVPRRRRLCSCDEYALKIYAGGDV